MCFVLPAVLMLSSDALPASEHGSFATVAQNVQPRIVKIMGIDIEASLGPNMLFVTNEDEPGFIGALGMVLGEAGVNIASFNLGRENNERGALAVALVHVDDEISDDVLAKVCALPHVRQVKALSF